MAKVARNNQALKRQPASQCNRAQIEHNQPMKIGLNFYTWNCMNHWIGSATVMCGATVHIEHCARLPAHRNNIITTTAAAAAAMLIMKCELAKFVRWLAWFHVLVARLLCLVSGFFRFVSHFHRATRKYQISSSSSLLSSCFFCLRMDFHTRFFFLIQAAIEFLKLHLFSLHARMVNWLLLDVVARSYYPGDKAK